MIRRLSAVLLKTMLIVTLFTGSSFAAQKAGDPDASITVVQALDMISFDPPPPPT